MCRTRHRKVPHSGPRTSLWLDWVISNRRDHRDEAAAWVERRFKAPLIVEPSYSAVRIACGYTLRFPCYWSTLRQVLYPHLSSLVDIIACLGLKLTSYCEIFCRTPTRDFYWKERLFMTSLWKEILCFLQAHFLWFFFCEILLWNKRDTEILLRKETGLESPGRMRWKLLICQPVLFRCLSDHV